jgi:enoyl-CoA hydratase/carnithine racemase
MKARLTSPAGPNTSAVSISRFSTVIYEKAGSIAIVTLNRPEKFNAYNVAMRDDLHQILGALYDDPDLRAMILMGAGASFSTGGDVSEFGSAPSPTIARWVRFRRDVWGLLHKLPIPTIAAVHGFTVGGGLEMALLCDLAVAADDTRICLPESGLGMIPGVAGTQTAALRGGLAWGLDLSITGRWIDGREALDIGLVTELVPRANLRARAIAAARRVSRLPRESVAIAKLAVWDGLDHSLRDGLALERRLGGRLAALLRTP